MNSRSAYAGAPLEASGQELDESGTGCAVEWGGAHVDHLDAEFGVDDFRVSGAIDEFDGGGGRHFFTELVQGAINDYETAIAEFAACEHLGVAVVFVRADGIGGADWRDRKHAALLASQAFHARLEQLEGGVRSIGFDVFHMAPVRNNETCVLLGRTRSNSGNPFSRDLREFCEESFRVLRNGWRNANGPGQALEVSIGVAMTPQCSSDSAELVEAAARAMAAAHYSGSAIQFFDVEASDRRTRSAIACDQVLGAIESNSLVPYYQPKVDMVSGEVVGAEALVRLRRNGAIVMPCEFLPFVTGHRAIVELDRAVMRMAMEQALRWQHKGLALHVAINLSARNLVDPSLPDIVMDALEALPLLDRSMLEFEVTESQEIDNLDCARKTIARLRAEGIRFHLDDFGTGYSSFDYLKRLPLDGIKIDQQFVRGMLKHETDHAVVQSLLGIARAFDVSAIAEGVEDLETARRLVSLGCRVAQGFCFSPALPADEFEAYVLARNKLSQS